MGKGSEEKISPQQEGLLNRVNQFTPFGSLTHTQDRGGPRFDRATSTITLDPAVQAVVDQQLMTALLTGQRGEDLLRDLAGGAANRQRVEQATLDRAMSLLGPEFARREEALRQRLANQGLPQASRAFESELGRFERGENEALTQAALQAVLAGGAEETRQMNLIAQLLGLTQAQQPTFAATPLIGVPGAGPGGVSPVAGALSGAGSGALAGAQIGSLFPGWGTAIGAGAGAIIGGVGGYAGTR